MAGDSPPQRVFYGRGGAGNISKATHSPRLEPLGTPTLKSKTYTTGRGGAGNMATDGVDHPELARERQDIDIPGIKLEEQPHHVGRGGAANAYKPSDAEVREARELNRRLLGGRAGGGADDRSRSRSKEARGVSRERGAAKHLVDKLFG